MTDLDEQIKLYVSGLAEYVGANESALSIIIQITPTAIRLVEKYTSGANIPDEIRYSAIMEVGANLYARRQSRRDMATWTENGLMESPRIPALDPLTPAYPILRPYLDPAVA